MYFGIIGRIAADEETVFCSLDRVAESAKLKIARLLRLRISNEPTVGVTSIVVFRGNLYPFIYRLGILDAFLARAKYGVSFGLNVFGRLRVVFVTIIPALLM